MELPDCDMTDSRACRQCVRWVKQSTEKKERKPNQIDLNGSQQLSQTNSNVIVNAIETQSKQNKGKLPIANNINQFRARATLSAQRQLVTKWEYVISGPAEKQCDFFLIETRWWRDRDVAADADGVYRMWRVSNIGLFMVDLESVKR